MERGPRWSWSGLLLAAGTFFAVPLHLTLEAHEAFHEASDEDHSHDGTDGRHPAVDHEIAALAKVPQIAFPVLALPVPAPAASAFIDCAWVPRIEPGANSPPESPGSPPRSPRAPPL